MTRKDILDAAEKIVTGERQQTYGEPEDNFGTIAQMWEAYLGVPISAMDVSMMMVLLKVARVSGRPDLTTIDNFIDICGYAACGGEVAYREGRTRDSHKKESNEDILKKRIAEMDVTKIINNIRHNRETEGQIAGSNPKKEHPETHMCDDPSKKVSVQDQDTLVNVSKGQDAYSVIGNYILNHVTDIEDMIAVIQINGVIIKELYMADADADGYFYWKSDWWEGEEDVALLDFFPVSDAERETDEDIRIRIPDPDRVFKARSKWEDEE